MAKNNKTLFVCSDCGNEFPNWSGRCPKCGSWNTLKEVAAESQKKAAKGAGPFRERRAPQKITELDASEELRFSTGIGEFNRVLGGGAVVGSLVLIGGAPGIGKSTVLLQMCGCISE